jgi:hypothetical protein
MAVCARHPSPAIGSELPQFGLIRRSAYHAQLRLASKSYVFHDASIYVALSISRRPIRRGARISKPIRGVVGNVEQNSK